MDNGKEHKEMFLNRSGLVVWVNFVAMACEKKLDVALEMTGHKIVFNSIDSV